MKLKEESVFGRDGSGGTFQAGTEVRLASQLEALEFLKGEDPMLVMSALRPEAPQIAVVFIGAETQARVVLVKELE